MNKLTVMCAYDILTEDDKDALFNKYLQDIYIIFINRVPYSLSPNSRYDNIILNIKARSYDELIDKLILHDKIILKIMSRLIYRSHVDRNIQKDISGVRARLEIDEEVRQRFKDCLLKEIGEEFASGIRISKLNLEK